MDLSYPIGRFDIKQPVEPAAIPALIDELAALPTQLRDAVRDLTPEQLDTPYRPGGWTVRQTVHHVADSPMNSYSRLPLPLPETEPATKPYGQQPRAAPPDPHTAPP